MSNSQSNVGNDNTKPVSPLFDTGELLLLAYQAHAPEAIAIHFGGEWLPIEKGSLQVSLEAFSCISGGRLILGQTKRLRALGFEQEESA